METPIHSQHPLQVLPAGQGGLQDEGLGDAGPARSAGPAPLPCLFVTTQTADVNRSAVAKRAETLYVNLSSLIQRVGLERVGFVTLTFSDHVTEHPEASRRFNNLSRRVFAGWITESICVPERQSSGRIHYHMVAAFSFNIRDGFDFASCCAANAAKRMGDFGEHRRLQRIYCQSANVKLRAWWRYLRNEARVYKFGRCETLPILSNAEGLARYIGAYVTTASCARLRSDKGVRTVRYALDSRAATLRWSWRDGNGARWRRGCAVLGGVLGLTYEEFRGHLGERWAWHWRKIVGQFADRSADVWPWVAKVPDWADFGSRVAFCMAVSRQLDGGTGDGWGLTEFEGNNPENPF